MDWKEIVQIVVDGIGAVEGIIRVILTRTGHMKEAEPWLTLGMVGVRYLNRVLQASDSDEIKAILLQSPRDLWRNAQDVETENSIIRQVQLGRVGEG